MTCKSVLWPKINHILYILPSIMTFMYDDALLLLGMEYKCTVRVHYWIGDEDNVCTTTY